MVYLNSKHYTKFDKRDIVGIFVRIQLNVIAIDQTDVKNSHFQLVCDSNTDMATSYGA